MNNTQEIGRGTCTSRTIGSALELSKLRIPQQHLYRLIKRCCDEGRMVKTSEIVECYQTHVQRSDGIYRSWKDDSAPGGYVDRFIPYADWEIRNYARMWFIRNIGVLVSRGYLLVVPMVLEDE